MTYRETIAGPWGPTTGSPFGARLCWSVTAATLRGDRIDARLAMPGADWIRLGSDGIRRQDQRLVFETVDAAIVTLSYDNALIRESDAFLQALANGGETTVDDQYMRMVAQYYSPGLLPDGRVILVCTACRLDTGSGHPMLVLCEKTEQRDGRRGHGRGRRLAGRTSR
jgi:hypothetical protein